ncbi:MAG: hypothetical protein PHC61_14535 [Chitinivibrionales bacterium]|nr:hypothetical protein [Chitinivibrionales bacterium]
MLFHDDNRSADVYSRLCKLSNAISAITILIHLVLGLIVGFAVGLYIGSQPDLIEKIGKGAIGSYGTVGAIIGGILGSALGYFIARFMTVIVDWMAQVLNALSSLASNPSSEINANEKESLAEVLKKLQ